MPSPLKSQLRVDKLLSEVSVKYKPAEFVAMDVFPVVSVMKESDLYRVYERNFRLEETERADGGAARESGFNISTSSYVLREHALKAYISDRKKDNYDVGDLNQDTTEHLTDQILRRLESDVADLFTTTNWSLNVSLASGDQFSADTTTAANPLTFFDTGATEIVESAGFLPNFHILPRSVMVALKNNTTYIWERIKYTSREITPAMLQGLLDSQELLVPSASNDTAAEGQAASISAIWGDNAFMGYKPNRPGPLAPSSGYIFMKSMPAVRRWRDEDRRSDVIEVSRIYDQKVVASLSGFLIRDCLA